MNVEKQRTTVFDAFKKSSAKVSRNKETGLAEESNKKARINIMDPTRKIADPKNKTPIKKSNKSQFIDNNQLSDGDALQAVDDTIRTIDQTNTTYDENGEIVDLDTNQGLRETMKRDILDNVLSDIKKSTLPNGSICKGKIAQPNNIGQQLKNSSILISQYNGKNKTGIGLTSKPHDEIAKEEHKKVHKHKNQPAPG